MLCLLSHAERGQQTCVDINTPMHKDVKKTRFQGWETINGNVAHQVHRLLCAARVAKEHKAYARFRHLSTLETAKWLERLGPTKEIDHME